MPLGWVNRPAVRLQHPDSSCHEAAPTLNQTLPPLKSSQKVCLTGSLSSLSLPTSLDHCAGGRNKGYCFGNSCGLHWPLNTRMYEAGPRAVHAVPLVTFKGEAEKRLSFRSTISRCCNHPGITSWEGIVVCGKEKTGYISLSHIKKTYPSILPDFFLLYTTYIEIRCIVLTDFSS